MRRLLQRHLEDVNPEDSQCGILEQCFKQTGHSLNKLFEEAYSLSRKNFLNRIHFYVPGMVHYETSFYQATDTQQFPGISVTGSYCYLNCKHCKGKLLEGMIPATTPEELFEVCTKIKRSGGTGCLISGGSLSDGSVPLMKFIPAIKRVKQDLGLLTVIHTGLVDASLAKALADTDIDAAMIDIIGSNDTIKEVCHLSGNIHSFDRSLTLLEQNDIPTVPHIVVGIHYGKLRGEKVAVEIVSKHHPVAIVIVALTPLDHTQMGRTEPPSPVEIARVLLALRLLMPQTPLMLGCARPRGVHKVETDILAIKVGVNGIAYPSEEAYELAKRLGLSIKVHEKCCSLLWQDRTVETNLLKADDSESLIPPSEGID